MKHLLLLLSTVLMANTALLAGPSEFWPLKPADQEELEAQRLRVYKTAEDRYGIKKFSGTKSDLYIIQTMINDKVFVEGNKLNQQALGVVFGDILANELGLKWVMVRDQYGTDPTLRLEGTNYQFNALTMISKRMGQKKKQVNVMKLYEDISRYVKKIKAAEEKKKASEA
ncbi:MAG: DUF3806 domain-containing protein [Verrucomicrobiae bacterium]|nr:DUF3806 domain-containing protein [Verrucomicrobiae bacterium]